jgi:hypothetical protein
VIHESATDRQAFAWRSVAFILALAASLANTACTGPGVSPSTAPAPQRDVLTRDEILASTAQSGDLYDAIRSLRPQFFAKPRGAYNRSSAAAAPLVVYINGVKQAGVETLRSLSASRIAEVRYLDPNASQNAYGLSATGGALVVKLYNPSDPE